MLQDVQRRSRIVGTTGRPAQRNRQGEGHARKRRVDAGSKHEKPEERADGGVDRQAFHTGPVHADKHREGGPGKA